MERLRSSAVMAGSLLIAAGVLGGGAGTAQAAGCNLGNGIKHVVQIQFDNVHLRRDNPNVPSDLELMPNLLPYLAATLVNAVSAAILASIGPRSARARPDRFPDPRHDAVLGQFQRRDDQRLVVVVDGADGDHPDGLSRSVLSDRRARRDRQSALAPNRLSAPALGAAKLGP